MKSVIRNEINNRREREKKAKKKKPMNKKIIWVEKKLFAIHPTSNRNNIFFSSSLSFHSFVHSIHFALSLVRLGSGTVVSVTRTFDASSISFRSTVWMLQRFVSIYIALFVDFFHIFFGYFFVSNEVTKSKWKKKLKEKTKCLTWISNEWFSNDEEIESKTLEKLKMNCAKMFDCKRRTRKD